MYSVLLPRIRAKDLSPTPSPFRSFPPPTDIFMLADQIPQHFPCTLSVCRFASNPFRDSSCTLVKHGRT